MTESGKYKDILRELKSHYGDAGTALVYRNPFELLIATILSAQCTDRRVNEVTRGLFSRYKGPEDFARLDPEKLAREIRSCGLQRIKSRNIIKVCRILIEKYGGRVPGSVEELERLPGVGRKTANVVASNAFGVDAIAVDTHVFRVSNRLGLAHANTSEKTESQLMANIPRSMWSRAHHWLVRHGREICTARKPKCNICFLSSYCEYYKKAGGPEKSV